jgi:hypothetical protein
VLDGAGETVAVGTKRVGVVVGGTGVALTGAIVTVGDLRITVGASARSSSPDGVTVRVVSGRELPPLPQATVPNRRVCKIIRKNTANRTIVFLGVCIDDVASLLA